MSTQHITTLLGATCCTRLATLLCSVATCWVLLVQMWPSSNLSQQHPTCQVKSGALMLRLLIVPAWPAVRNYKVLDKIFTQRLVFWFYWQLAFLLAYSTTQKQCMHDNLFYYFITCKSLVLTFSRHKNYHCSIMHCHYLWQFACSYSGRISCAHEMLSGNTELRLKIV